MPFPFVGVSEYGDRLSEVLPRDEIGVARRAQQQRQKADDRDEGSSGCPSS